MTLDRPIFIVGLPRSGSTVWQQILAGSPDLLNLHEFLFLSPWHPDFRTFRRKYASNLSRDETVLKMLDRIFTKPLPNCLYRTFWHKLQELDTVALKDRLAKAILDSDRSLESIFKAMIEQVASLQDRPRCCVKFPLYPCYIGNLIEWYPRCKIVHITRDPRATAISKTNDPGGTRKLTAKYPRLQPSIRKGMMLFVVAQYIWTSHVHRKYRKHPNYALFRYEDLLVRPHETVKRLCEFVEVDFREHMLGFQRAQWSSITGRRTGGLDVRAASRWKGVISPLENWLVTALTNRAMRRFDFNPFSHPIYAGTSDNPEAVAHEELDRP